MSPGYAHTTYCLKGSTASEDRGVEREEMGQKEMGRGRWNGALELFVPKREELKKKGRK